MKYVAFLDILGFKNKLKRLSQSEAKMYIGDFSLTVYSIFQNTDSQLINGYIVSDSIIIYTNNVSEDALKALAKVVEKVCKEEFSQHGILIRGAISKGEFDNIPAIELPHLQKQLIVGQAYVEAYLLEDSVKTIGINLSESVYQDLKNSGSNLNIIEEKIKDQVQYILRYITIDYLLDENNMSKFVDLAIEANWLPHYYNTLYFAMKRETNDNKVEQVFVNILNLVCDNKPSENWRDIDSFIKNSFNDNVIDNYKVRFLKYIRKNLF